MIFACGVRFMCLKSVAVKGCASRSARAPLSIASADVGLGILPEIVVLFCKTDDYKALFAIVFTVIQAFNSERVPKYFLGQLEAHTVSPQVRLCLGLVPLKFQFHDTTGYQ